MSSANGMRLLGPAPAKDVVFGAPPTGQGDGHNRYLWIIDNSGIPHIVESPLGYLDGHLPKHTNLTGGSPAFVGGELWFSTGHRIFVSGGSGRYPPRDSYQLQDACEVFEAFNYDVSSLGWNEQSGSAERILR